MLYYFLTIFTYSLVCWKIFNSKINCSLILKITLVIVASTGFTELILFKYGLGYPSIMMIGYLFHLTLFNEPKKGQIIYILFGILFYLSFFLPFLPYLYGWGFYPAMPMMLIVIILGILWRNSAYLILLVICLIAYCLKIQPSTNLWDYLIDPFFYIFCCYSYVRKKVIHSPLKRN